MSQNLNNKMCLRLLGKDGEDLQENLKVFLYNFNKRDKILIEEYPYDAGI